jgi:DNA repair protein SbcD/Mre11
VLLSNPQRWKNELRAIATDVGGGKLWLEKIRFGTKESMNTTALAAKSRPLLELMHAIDGLAGNAHLVQAAVAALGDLAEKLPHELKSGDEAILLNDPETVKLAAEGVRQVLMDRILAGGAEL